MAGSSPASCIARIDSDSENMTNQPPKWRNRIVGYGEEKADQLLANEANWRIHPKPQQDSLSGILNEVGWVQNVIINRRTSEEWGKDRLVETLVDGHLRVALAISHGNDTVPVTYVDLTPGEEKFILATIDPISAMAVTDKEQLDALLREIDTGEVAVQKMLSELAFEEKIIEKMTSEGTRGLSPDERLDIFMNATIKQIVLYFPIDEYDRVIELFGTLRDQFQVETNTEVVIRLLEQYGTIKSPAP